MNRKHNSPRVITLRKSATGMLEAEKSPDRRFRPWQRLWFAVGILYLLMLAGTFFLIAPTRDGVERRMVFAITEEVRRYDGMAFAGESPRKVFAIARSQGFSDWIRSTRSRYRIGPEGNAGFDRIEKEYRENLSDLPVKQTFGLLLCAVAWILPMAALYAVGFVVDWIRGIAGNVRE